MPLIPNAEMGAEEDAAEQTSTAPATLIHNASTPTDQPFLRPLKDQTWVTTTPGLPFSLLGVTIAIDLALPLLENSNNALRRLPFVNREGLPRGVPLPHQFPVPGEDLHPDPEELSMIGV